MKQNIFRAIAPLRISFSGGGTDLPPYPEERGGLVLNATIDRFAYATVRIIPEKEIRLYSNDFMTKVQYAFDEPIEFDGNLDLAKACIKRILPERNNDNGIELILETDVPSGSGLGGSSSLVVAAVSALCKWRDISFSNDELARLAWEIEREDVGILGGEQDQYAAVLGGFNLLEFYGNGKVKVNPISVEEKTILELQHNLLMVYLGKRKSKTIISKQISGFKKKKKNVVDALDRMKVLTIESEKCLVEGNLIRLAEILHEEWTEKRKTESSVSNEHIDIIYEEARKLGVIGGKVSGAGGGGYMFLFCPYDQRSIVSNRLMELGCEVSSFSFYPYGVKAWSWVYEQQ